MSRVLFHLCSDLQNSQNGIYLSIVFTFFTSFHLWNHPFHLLYIYTAFLQLIITTGRKIARLPNHPRDSSRSKPIYATMLRRDLKENEIFASVSRSRGPPPKKMRTFCKSGRITLHDTTNRQTRPRFAPLSLTPFLRYP